MKIYQNNHFFNNKKKKKHYVQNTNKQTVEFMTISAKSFGGEGWPKRGSERKK